MRECGPRADDVVDRPSDCGSPAKAIAKTKQELEQELGQGEQGLSQGLGQELEVPAELMCRQMLMAATVTAIGRLRDGVTFRITMMIRLRRTILVVVEKKKISSSSSSSAEIIIMRRDNSSIIENTSIINNKNNSGTTIVVLSVVMNVVIAILAAIIIAIMDDTTTTIQLLRAAKAKTALTVPDLEHEVMIPCLVALVVVGVLLLGIAVSITSTRSSSTALRTRTCPEEEEKKGEDSSNVVVTSEAAARILEVWTSADASNETDLGSKRMPCEFMWCHNNSSYKSTTNCVGTYIRSSYFRCEGCCNGNHHQLVSNRS